MTDPIDRVSPSLFARLVRCGLAEALSRAQRSGGVTPSRPPARLGTAAHLVIEDLIREVTTKAVPADVRAWVRARWETHTQTQYEKAQRFEEERNFGHVSRWPGFFDIEARLVMEALSLTREAVHWEPTNVHLERWIESDALGLEGKPDLVLTQGEARLVDYKSGRPRPEDVLPGSTYARQLAVYSALLRSIDIEVGSAAIKGLGRPALEVHVTIDDEQEVAEAARSLAGQFNDAVARGAELELGQPSDEACGWCPHAATCPALWSSLDNYVEMQSISGEVTARKESARGLSLRIEVERGTKDGLVTIAQLPRVGHLGNVEAGDQVRVVGLIATASANVLAAPRGGWVRAAPAESASVDAL